MSKKIIIIFSVSLSIVLAMCFFIIFLTSNKTQSLDADLLKNRKIVNEAIEKIGKLSAPTFTKDDPDVVIGEIFQVINLRSLFQFTTPETSWQWWVSDDGWNILDKNAIVVSAKIPVINAQDKYTGEFQPKGPEHPLSQALNKFISDIFEKNGFQLNSTNTSRTYDDESLFDYAISFQRGELRCSLITSNSGAQTDGPDLEGSDFYIPYSISCSNEFNKAYQEQVPYLKLLEDRDSVVIPEKKIGDFIYLDIHYHVSGFFIIGKIEDTKIRIIFAGQEYPPCNLMEDNQVPKEIYEKCDESNYPYTPPTSYKTVWSRQLDPSVASTSNEVAQWKIYTNTKYGIEVKYPDYWEVDSSIEYSPNFNYVPFLDISNPEKFERIGLGIFNLSNSGNYDFSSTTSFEKWHDGNMISNKIEKIEKSKIGDLDAIKTYEADGVDSMGEYVYILYNDLIIFFTHNSADNAQIQSIFDRMISTFKFIK